MNQNSLPLFLYKKPNRKKGMKMNGRKIEAALVAVGLLLLGVEIREGINDFSDRERVVTVKGLAEREVPADKVVWPFS